MAETQKVYRIIIDSSKAVDGSRSATKALQDIERQTSTMAGGLAKAEQAIASMGMAVKAHLALALAQASARLVQIGKDAFDAASGMGELAEQMGITTRGLQALQYSAVQNGVKLEQLETGVSKFSQKIGEAAGGSKEMIESLNDMGVKILDMNGKLRPTETLMSEVAAAILAIDDPAKRSAASVDFFGKAGTKFLPVLQDMAKGLDAMGAAADRGGAMISERAITRLDELGDAAARSGLKMRAAFANSMVEVLDEIEARLAKINIGFSEADFAKGAATNKRWMEEISNFFGSGLRSALDEAALAGGRFVVTFISYFQSLPEQLPKLFIDAMNGAITAVEGGLNEIGGNIAREYPWLAGKAGISGNVVQFGRLDGGGANTASERFSSARQAGIDWETGKRAEFAGVYARQKEERDRADLIARQAGFASDEDRARRGKLGGVDGGGKFNPNPKGGGGSEDPIVKLQRDGKLALEAAQAFADASAAGAAAVGDLEIHYKAVKEAQDAWTKSTAKGKISLEELTRSVEETLKATDKAKNIKEFGLATETLEKQNALLAAENGLANETVEVRTREVALLKLKQEIEEKGYNENDPREREMLDRRREAIALNAKLTAQGAEIKAANELWTEPLKQAFRNIQTSAADAWENILTTGKFSFDSLGEVFKKTITRMAAEFLALATIRPVMSVLVQATTSAGLMSSATAQQMGFAGQGGGGGLSMPSFGGGGLSDMFGGTSIGGWLNSPITGFGGALQGSSPAAMAAPTGATGASGLLGGTTWGQGIGAIAGIGMGAYTLANSKGTGSTISGIGQMVGGAVSLIPGFGQIAGPLIMLASTIAGSLIGDGEGQRTHSSTNASLHYGNGSWYTTGGAYGSGANSGQSESALRGTTAGIDSVFGLMGGVKDPSKVWGLNLNSWTAQGKDWSYTSRDTSLVDPTTGSQEAWRMNMDDMMDTGAAQVAIRSILSGAVGEISSTMKTALESMRAAAMGVKETAESIVFVDEVYERLGKGTLTVRAQLRDLDSQFAKMTETAKKLGLSLAPVEAEQKRATERLAQDYIDNLIDPIAVSLRAWEDEKKSILANVDYLKANTDVVVNSARINEALLRKEAALKEQLYGGAISQLEDAISRLMPGGNLANLDPTGTLAGIQASYQATYAQARAGDAAAIGRLGSESTAYADYAKSYYAGSPEYNAIKLQIIEALQTVQDAVTGPASTDGGSAPAAATNGTAGQLQQLTGTVNNLIAELQQERAESAKLRAVLSRYVTTQAA